LLIGKIEFFFQSGRAEAPGKKAQSAEQSAEGLLVPLIDSTISEFLSGRQTVRNDFQRRGFGAFENNVLELGQTCGRRHAGYAVADVNYGGSTGYGRKYRKRLAGNWGIVDVDDCSNAAT